MTKTKTKTNYGAELSHQFVIQLLKTILVKCHRNDVKKRKYSWNRK